MPYRAKKTIIIDEKKYNKQYSIKSSVEDYVEYINARNGGTKGKIAERKINTYRRKKSDLGKFTEFLKDSKYDIRFTFQINNEVIDDFQKYIYALKKPNGEEFAPNSKISFFTSFKSYVQYLALHNAIRKETYIYVENADTFTFSKRNIQMEEETGYLTPSQIRKMYNNIEKYYKHSGRYRRNVSIFMLLLHGLRRDEIRTLKWRDIDFDNGVIKVYRKKVTKQNTIYINIDTLKALKSYFDVLTIDLQHKDCYVFPGQTLADNIQTWEGAKPISSNTIGDIVSKISEDELDSEGKPITARTFRKTFTVQNMKLGNTLNLIQTYTQHTLGVLQKNYATYIQNAELNPEASVERYFDFVFNGKEDDLSYLTVNDVIKNDRLNKELEEYYFKSFMNKLSNIKAGI